ncbi:hypothetical protein LOZ58_002771 [Ophidiomyces ophidiicola]|nr:hypothetical protein LOZ58_002771 [Ophidiomyces ophidiicola]
MPITGVYFIPANPGSPTALATVMESLRSTCNATPIDRWVLEHKLLRDTPSCLPPSSYSPLPQLQPRFMHFLTLSHFPSHSFVNISDRPDPDPWAPGKHHPTSTGSSISTAQQLNLNPRATAEKHGSGEHSSKVSQSSPSWTMMTLDTESFQSFFTMTLRICEPLWSLRHTMVVAAGIVYDAGEFRVRLGDVQQIQPLKRTRGCVIEIEYRDNKGSLALANGDAETASLVGDGWPGFSDATVKEDLPTEEDWETGEKIIRQFWKLFAVDGAREAIRVPGLMTEAKRAKQNGVKRLTAGDAGASNDGIAGADLARQYMEVLRLNR